MKISNNYPSIATGLALFAMFFGAGNVTFPLLLGQISGDGLWVALAGLLFTAVLMPLFGLITMMMFDGDYEKFFLRVGKIPAYFLITLSMALIGPFLIIPRTIVVAHDTLSFAFYDIPMWQFSLGACLFTAIFCYKKNQTVDLIGWILTPLLLSLLVYIIFCAIQAPLPLPHTEQSKAELFLSGLTQGYNTLDLIGAIFFASIAIQNIHRHLPKNHTKKEAMISGLKASFIGGSLLAVIYLGSAYISAMYSHEMHVNNLQADQLLASLAHTILGNIGGKIASIVVALACLTTAISCVAISTDFLYKTIFKEKVYYGVCLILIIDVTFLTSLLGFSLMMKLITPVLLLTYPVYIMITVCNFANKQFGIQAIKLPAFIISLLSVIYFVSIY